MPLLCVFPLWSKIDTKWYLGVQRRKCRAPILFGVDRNEGEGQPVPTGKLVLTCSLAERRHQTDYSTAAVSRSQKQPDAVDGRKQGRVRPALASKRFLIIAAAVCGKKKA